MHKQLLCLAIVLASFVGVLYGDKADQTVSSVPDKHGGRSATARTSAITPFVITKRNVDKGQPGESEPVGQQLFDCSNRPKKTVNVTVVGDKAVVDKDPIKVDSYDCLHIHVQTTGNTIDNLVWISKDDLHDPHANTPQKKENATEGKWLDRCGWRNPRRTDCWLYMNFPKGKYPYILVVSDPDGGNPKYADPEVDVSCSGPGCPLCFPPDLCK